MAHTFHIGQFVTNFGITAEVIGFHPVTGDLILKEPGKRSKWIADSGKCKPADEAVLHKDGLVAFG